MKLAELLRPSGVRLDLEVDDLAGALRALLGTLPAAADLSGGARDKFARDLAFGSAGEVVRLAPDVLIVLGARETLSEHAVCLGVAREAFQVTGAGPEPEGTARVVLLGLTPGRLSALKGGIVPVLKRYFSQPRATETLLKARSADEVLGAPGLGELEVREELRVDAALAPVSYRVYPDTPFDEVLDLIVRRELHAVPVVGESYEVMGIITAGDALRDLLPRSGAKEGASGKGDRSTGRTARDVMTRTVMCVSEDQSLQDAATLMVNRDVEQLPVVREGELIGMLTRDAALRVLFGR